jgi:diadenosine tetraphosphate (Ap4A) HIT family hydrolase
MEMDFQLDPRLARDCFKLGTLESGNLLLLHKNAAMVWLIVVPQTTYTELFQLPQEQQQLLLDEINLLSAFLKTEYGSDKINVATIGNIVSQLHIHIIGRTIDDPYWPAVVWGQPATREWPQTEMLQLIRKLQASQIIYS